MTNSALTSKSNPGGGSGQEVASAAWQVALNLSDTYGFSGLESFDFLGKSGPTQGNVPALSSLILMLRLAMDLRGSYSSNPLNCSLGNLTLPSYMYVLLLHQYCTITDISTPALCRPSTEEEFIAYQAIIATYARSCIDRSTPKGIVAHIGTDETVQDWDNLRHALGYEKMNLLGYS